MDEVRKKEKPSESLDDEERINFSKRALERLRNAKPKGNVKIPHLWLYNYDAYLRKMRGTNK